MIIYGNTQQHIPPQDIISFLSSLKPITPQGCSIEPKFYKYLVASAPLPKWIRPGMPKPSSDFVLSIGGDGTFLQAVAWSARASLPVLGVNTGHLGYLTAYTLEENSELIDDFINGNIIKEKRRLLQINTENLPGGIWPYALNEVAVLKSDSSSMIDIRTEIDGLYLTDYLADGLLVSTPTGSTGYNLSVGGPIMQPTLKCTLLTPVAPHSLTMRPLVVDGNSKITLCTSGRASCYRVSLDGRSFILPSGSKISISPAPFDLLIMHRKSQDFASTLRNKLSWGQR